MSISRFIQIGLEFVFIELSAVALGAGLGFLQGCLVFYRQKTELMLQFGGWSALTGGAVAGVVLPLLYYYLIRSSVLSLWTVIEMSTIIIFIGLLSAYILSYLFDSGWLSWIITPVAAIIITILYCKFDFMLLKP